ncbi:MAG: polyprenyl synthetase family protein [Oscillospiraceae bacterium]|nr:polyprenyl synthetase family protein [Oscillospiraceae bacterium]
MMMMEMMEMMETIEQKLKNNAETVNAALEKYLLTGDFDYEALYESMRYSSLVGGKRARAFLTLEFFSVFGRGQNPEIALPAACAIEMIHTYSLIHDDLPCMDNDDLRRGQPSNHKKFGEAVALLAGDALLTYAFGIIADAELLSGEKKLAIISELSKAAGHAGMIGGQMMDMRPGDKNMSLDAIVKTHSLKTGSLITASATAGCAAAGATREETGIAAAYAKNIGLAFQIVDDILDKDEEGAAGNFVNILGGDETKAFEYAKTLTDKALASLEEQKKRDKSINTENLGIFAKYLLERRN